jgi:putative membrane protein
VNMPTKRCANERGLGRVCKGLAAGLIGGLVASWTMNRFQDGWSKLAQGNRMAPLGQDQLQTRQLESDEQGSVEPEDDTTVTTASAISEGIFDHKLTQREKKIAGTAVHYALGTGVGGLYGAVAEVAPKVTTGAGLPFGAVFWLVVDEGAVPLLGLSKGPTAYPLSTHAYALSSHFVYGLTAEIVRRVIRRAL